MATALRKAHSSADTELLWQAIEALEGYELQNLLTNELLAETDRPRGFMGSSRVELVRELVGRGADVNAVRADGFTPLLLAVFFGHLDVVKLLVEHGADVKACTRFGTSAEMWAQARGFKEIVEYLDHCEDRSLQLDTSSSENNDWFKESLVAEPVIEESSTFAAPAPACEENLQSPILQASLDSDGHDDQNITAEPVIEEPSTFEAVAAPVEEQLQPAVSSTTFETNEDDDERTLVRPRIEQPVLARTLKDPPEIWDIVHENRNSFNPRLAFVSRVGSFRVRILLLIFLIGGFATAIGFATMRLRHQIEVTTAQSVELRKEDASVQPERAPHQSSAAVIPEVQPTPSEEKPDNHQKSSFQQNRRTKPSPSTQFSAEATQVSLPVKNSASPSEPKILPAIQRTITSTRPADPAIKPTNSNSKLIQSSAPTQPHKPKVIQWP